MFLIIGISVQQSRDVNQRDPKKVRDANMYFCIEACIALFVSFVINVFVVAVFAHGLYGKENIDIVSYHRLIICHYQMFKLLSLIFFWQVNMCNATNNHPLYDEAVQIFGKNTDIVDADLYKGGIFLGCAFGVAAMYIWAVGILAAGQSSTMTGTYAGQFVMEGFLNLQWSRWKRVFFTRLIAIVPTFCLAYFNDIQHLTGMNDILNTVMTLQLPFAVIPTITFTSSVVIMGEFVNGIANKIVSIALFLLVIGINIVFIVDRVNDWGLTWEWISLIGEYK